MSRLSQECAAAEEQAQHSKPRPSWHPTKNYLDFKMHILIHSFIHSLGPCQAYTTCQPLQQVRGHTDDKICSALGAPSQGGLWVRQQG